MLRPDSAARRDIVTDFAIGIVAEVGIAGLTVRGLARRIGVTPAGVHHWVGSRSAMLLTVTVAFGQRWLAWIHRRSYQQGALALLPANAEEIAWTRVWLALGEVSRTADDLAEVTSEFRTEERALLHRLRPDLPGDLLDAAMALVDGLRLAVSARQRPLGTAEARALLAGQLDAWASNGEVSCDLLNV